MKPESLFASAAINIGLAMVVLTLFSVLRKQPPNAFIYFARRLSQHHHVQLDRSFTLLRFIPSFSWITRAFRVSEDEIIDTTGLDALVIIRLFKFGIKFFVPCSILGLVILLPVNYYTSQDVPSEISHSMDSYTISNISRGSDRLWVHFTCLWLISFYGLYLLYKEYNDILLLRTQQIRKFRHRPDQFTVLVREIPLCDNHKARGCCVDHFFSKHYPDTYQSYQMLYHLQDFEDLLAKSLATTIEDVKKRSVTRKRNRESLHFGEFREDSAKPVLHEEKLQELCRKICQIRGKNMLREKEFPVAFVTFKSRCTAALAAQSQQHSNPLLWITEMAPEPRDVLWENLLIPWRYLLLHKIGVYVAASLFTIFFAIPVTAVQGIAKFDNLKKWFPPAMAIELIPGLSSVVTGYLPSAILNGFIYVVPFGMLAMAKLAGCISRSKQEIKACNMFFYFLVGNVFFLSLLSGSLLDEIGKSVTHPKDFPGHLASAVSAQADFFMTYILTTGLSGFSLEILQSGLLIWDFVKSHTFANGKKKEPYLYSLHYCRVIPMVSLAVLIGMIYAVVAPLLLPFLIVYFFLGYVVYINQIQNVYETVYETWGKYWPYVHHYILIALVLMQITMIGLFGLKRKPTASFATIPLLLLTLMFNEYCKMRFLPTFAHCSVEDAKESDELDEKSGLMETNFENAINAYCPPCLRPVNFLAPESSSTQPLISSV